MTRENRLGAYVLLALLLVGVGVGVGRCVTTPSDPASTSPAASPSR